MKRTLSLLFTMILPVFGTIIETHHFHEILSHANADTLILLDIDDTILIAPQMLGTDEWLYHQTQEREKIGISSPDAFIKSLAEWEAIRHITAMELVEPGINAVIHSLQALGFPVMGLTTQSITLAIRTAHHLKEHQLDLSLSAPFSENHCLKINRRNVFYIDGILFTSGASKAESLFALCDKIGYFPKRILLIDDKGSHLKDMERAAEARQIEFVGLRYAYSDARKNAFCPHVANCQFTHSTFHRLLSDEEARKLIESK
jgi:phosphoglycolate phosphatase-like HAD superfamily hydrolase